MTATPDPPGLDGRRVFRSRAYVGDDPVTVDMPAGPILHVDATTLGAPHSGAQYVVDFWWERDDTQPNLRRTFIVLGTGHRIPAGAQHCGTTDRTPAGFVWHLYELEATAP